MKRLFPVLLCCLALPLAAQSVSRAKTQPPEAVYEALLTLPAIEQEQKELRERGFELDAQRQEQLTRLSGQVKGLMVIELGYLSCVPCNKLLNLLAQKDEAQNKSMVEQWRDWGVRFYQLDWLKDRQTRDGKNLSALWEIKSVPVLVFIKDGREIGRLMGYDSSKPQQTLDRIKQFTLQNIR